MLFPAAALLALLPVATFGAPSGVVGKRAPLLPASASTRAIAGKYIVKFKNDAVTTAAVLTSLPGTHKVDHVYTSDGFKGFAGALDAAALEAIRNLAEVGSAIGVSDAHYGVSKLTYLIVAGRVR